VKIQHSYEQTWQVHGYTMLSMDLGVAFPFSTMKHWLCSFVDKNWFFTFENNIGSMYYSKQEMELAGFWGRKDFLDATWFSAYISNSQKLYSQAEKLFQKYTEDKIIKADKETLYKIVREMGLLLTELYGYFNASQPQCVSLLEKDLELEISKTAPKEKVRKLMLELTRSEDRTLLDEEEIEWLKLCSSERDDLQNALEAHSAKYGIIGTSDGGSYYTADYYRELYAKRDEAESKIKLHKKLSQEKTIKKKKKDLVIKYNISEQAQKLAEILSTTGHERFEIRLRGWMPVDYWFTSRLLPSFKKLFGIDVKLAKQLTFQELLQFLSTGEYDLSELKKRDDYFVIGMKNGRVFLQSGDEGRVGAEKLLPDLIEYENELSGQIAQMGFIRGNAYVFSWNAEDITKETEEMPKGSILVAGQTRPQLMSAIRKSAAIVTDEGGITSHAAIVARELGVPCIIGTKIATKIIKTGDLLEVDANKGKVRIIKSK
jgi:phosphohistidine swiveling domain-containing protein